MHDGLKTLQTMVGAQLAKEPLPSPERIRELIGHVKALPFCGDVTDFEAEELAQEFESVHGVTMKIGSVLEDQKHEPWLDAARAKITPYYWDRYQKLLAAKGFSGQVLATLDEVTERTLGLLGNPAKAGSWDRRGMVVGHVQSGKTANYTGLICKAADAGYKLIVIIAGIHNNLRNQTQLRIDEGFVGRDSSRLLSNKDDPAQKYIGVGCYDKTRRPVTFTNSLRDFSKTTASGVGVPLQNLNEPAVFVIKKNSSTLKNLLEWLGEHNSKTGADTIDVPMLLIDDEADNASINIRKGPDEVSKINRQIRELLRLFSRSCYVGYTATPFANIFIDPASATEMLGADLFPRNFIISLEAPDNYFGARKVFIENSESIIRHIEDNQELLPTQHSKDFSIVGLPGSLKNAVRVFILARAIRIARGQLKKHSSMLVNTSRFTDVQRQLRNEVHVFVEQIRKSVRLNGALPESKALSDPEIAALRNSFYEFSNTCEFAWGEIQGLLLESIAPIKVVEVNSRSSGALNYAENEKNGLNVIAIGGFSLSRGLTLEGLIVSYFLRNSMMYDTLMQMGRWFGYRPGYEDLCRIWMPVEAEGWYAHITESIEELRDELKKMEAANATPEFFGLKVRSHPDTLIVTARNKMGSGEKLVVSIGLANRFIETATLRRDDASSSSNYHAAIKFAADLAGDGYLLANEEFTRGGYLLQGVPVDHVLNFISSFKNHPGSMLTEVEPVKHYIEDRAATELEHWDVLFAGVKEKNSKGLLNSELGIALNCQRRSVGSGGDRSTLRISKQRVSSRGVEKAGLTDEEIKVAEKKHRLNEGVEEGGDKRVNYPDRIYRAVRRRPLLVIHLLAIGDEHEDLSAQQPVVAWSISFPSTLLEERKVEYVVNTTWVREHFGLDLDDEEMDGDDDK
jgi:hypothetical protein